MTLWPITTSWMFCCINQECIMVRDIITRTYARTCIHRIQSSCLIIRLALIWLESPDSDMKFIHSRDFVCSLFVLPTSMFIVCFAHQYVHCLFCPPVWSLFVLPTSMVIVCFAHQYGHCLFCPPVWSLFVLPTSMFIVCFAHQYAGQNIS